METKQNERKLGIRDMTYISLFAALISICSWICIPTAVPFTMQTFAVFAALSTLGGKRGTLAILVYILLGAIGVPVFAGFKSGLGTLFGATGGYVLGFMLSGLLYWFLSARFGEKLFVTVCALLGGLLLCYAFGTVWFMQVYAKSTGPIGLGAALSMCVLPFVIPDFIKMALSIVCGKKFKRFVT